MSACPHCGRAYPPDIVLNGHRRQRLIEALLKHPDGLSSDRLKTVIYADDPHGGSEDNHIVAVMVFQANIRLRPMGYVIKTHGKGMPYFLTEYKHADSVIKPARDRDPRPMGVGQPAGPARLDRRRRAMVGREPVSDRSR
jgi:hypothetical protein